MRPVEWLLGHVVHTDQHCAGAARSRLGGHGRSSRLSNGKRVVREGQGLGGKLFGQLIHRVGLGGAGVHARQGGRGLQPEQPRSDPESGVRGEPRVGAFRE